MVSLAPPLGASDQLAARQGLEGVTLVILLFVVPAVIVAVGAAIVTCYYFWKKFFNCSCSCSPITAAANEANVDTTGNAQGNWKGQGSVDATSNMQGNGQGQGNVSTTGSTEGRTQDQSVICRFKVCIAYIPVVGLVIAVAAPLLVAVLVLLVATTSGGVTIVLIIGINFILALVVVILLLIFVASAYLVRKYCAKCCWCEQPQETPIDTVRSFLRTASSNLFKCAANERLIQEQSQSANDSESEGEPKAAIKKLKGFDFASYAEAVIAIPFSSVTQRLGVTPEKKTFLLFAERKEPSNKVWKRWVIIYFLTMTVLAILWFLAIFIDNIWYRKVTTCNDVNSDNTNYVCYRLDKKGALDSVTSLPINCNSNNQLPDDIICYILISSPFTALGSAVGVLRAVIFLADIAFHISLWLCEREWGRVLLVSVQIVAILFSLTFTIVIPVLHIGIGSDISFLKWFFQGRTLMRIITFSLIPLTVAVVPMVPWWAFQGKPEFKDICADPQLDIELGTRLLLQAQHLPVESPVDQRLLHTQQSSVIELSQIPPPAEPEVHNLISFP